MEWYLKVLRQYADFSGRARRKEYWMFTLFNVIFICIAIILDSVFGLSFNGMGYGLVYSIYCLVVLVPGLAVGIRRLHDVGKSGWMVLVSLIPLIGWIWILILFCREGQLGENKWGANPKISEA